MLLHHLKVWRVFLRFSYTFLQMKPYRQVFPMTYPEREVRYMSTGITLAIAAVICASICRLSKWYVNNYCQDNPETTWIWLDDEDTESGHPVRINTLIQIPSASCCC